ncbi:MAG TPA: hypothetical protein PKX00_25445 [Opitutaceae bacterium]|nr:hypothetical protein [Opitutaceae bacterium]
MKNVALWTARLYAGKTALLFIPATTLAAAALAYGLLPAFGLSAPFVHLVEVSAVAQAIAAAIAYFVRRYPERYLGER